MVTILSLFFGIAALADSPSLRLEGVIVDKENPESSVAVLNGELVKKGERTGNYRVLEIQNVSVRVVDEQTGKESEVPVTGGEKPELKKAATIGEENKAKEEGSKNSGGFGKLSEMWSKMNPAAAVNAIWERLAIRDLAMINNAAVTYYEAGNPQGKKEFPRHFKQLVATGHLPESFEDAERKNYKYTMDPESMGFGVHADPIDPNSNLKHFFVGQDAIIREEIGKPATAKSKASDY